MLRYRAGVSIFENLWINHLGKVSLFVQVWEEIPVCGFTHFVTNYILNVKVVLNPMLRGLQLSLSSFQVG